MGAVQSVLVLSLILVFSTISLNFSYATESTPVIPNFWDPKSMVDRPNASDLKIQFLATDDFPPFSFRDADGRLTGFNIDLARAMCQELGTACSLRIKAFDALLPALEEEEGDAIISGLTASPALVDKIRFSDTYLRLPARFAVRDLSDFREDAPAGKLISVAKGSRHEAFVKQFFPTAIMVSLDTAEIARKTLEDGEVDAHFGDGMSLSFWMNGNRSEGCCRFEGGPWLEPGYFDRGLAIAVRAEDDVRLNLINYALRRLHERGTYRELYLRYFPVGFY